VLAAIDAVLDDRAILIDVDHLEPMRAGGRPPVPTSPETLASEFKTGKNAGCGPIAGPARSNQGRAPWLPRTAVTRRRPPPSRRAFPRGAGTSSAGRRRA
jgi:hypothetical protein